VLREQEAGVPAAEVCRKHGVSPATFDKWEAKFGGLDVSNAKRLRSLEENGRLKRMLADAMLDNAALKDLLGEKVATPATRREAATCLHQTFEMSGRRACRVIGTDRMTCAIKGCDRTTWRCANGSKLWPSSDGGSATAACTCCCGARATPSTGSGCSGYREERLTVRRRAGRQGRLASYSCRSMDLT
jgi:putative transposase